MAFHRYERLFRKVIVGFVLYQFTNLQILNCSEFSYYWDSFSAMLFYRNPGIVPCYILNLLAIFHFFLLLSYFLLPGSTFKPFLLTYIFLLLTSFFLCFSLFLRLFFSHYCFEQILFLFHLSTSHSITFPNLYAFSSSFLIFSLPPLLCPTRMGFLLVAYTVLLLDLY